MQTEALEKVTCFITRMHNQERQLLLFEHPNAGIQFPAGTVEPDEPIEAAVIREAFEETGLSTFEFVLSIGRYETRLPEKRLAILKTADVHIRPDYGSEVWGQIRRGLQVTEKRLEAHYIQVTYEEEDQYPNPNYISFQLTGWVHESCLTGSVARTFYHLEAENNGQEEWFQEADGYRFRLFWTPIEQLF